MPDPLQPAAIDEDARAGATVNGKPSLTNAQAGAQIDRGTFWWNDQPGQPAAVTYAFRADAPTTPIPDGGAGFERLTPAQMTAAMLSLEAISDVANISFTRVGSGVTGDAAYSDSAQILIGAVDSFTNPNQTGVTRHSPTRTAGSVAGVFIRNNGTEPNPGSALADTFTHELGHSVGLSHPSDYDVADGTMNSYLNQASYAEDDRQYSLMSYFPASATNGCVQYKNAPQAPQIDDIAALQQRYGANSATRAGDTVYGFNSNTDRPWYTLTSADQHITAAIWDGGGTDTLDFSGYAQNQLIDLREGNFSNVGGDFGNVAIAIGAKIENGVGGSGVDVIYGNALDNTLRGGAGDDRLYGGAGTDTAAYSGAAADYAVTSNADGSWTVADGRAGSPDGTDTLTSIETLAFSDGTRTIGVDLSADLSAEITAVLRASPQLAANLALDAGVTGRTTSAAAPAIVAAALSTTAVATLTYQFFTGATPSAAGMDYLVSPTGSDPANLNSAYYGAFGVENRYINFGVALGTGGGAGAQGFAAAYGALSFYDAFKQAYGVVFGATPSDDKVHAILDPTVTSNGLSMTRQQYFALYGGDGPAGIGTKAAAVGWLLGEAAKADVGVYARADDALLTDVALNGQAKFGVDMIGTYAKPEYAFHG